MTNISEHKQVWTTLTRFIYSSTEGCVTLELYDIPQDSKGVQAYICNLMVEPEYRGKGYGTQLLEWAERKAREEGFGRVYLGWERSKNKQYVFNWYKKMGYNEIAFSRDGSLMMKKL